MLFITWFMLLIGSFLLFIVLMLLLALFILFILFDLLSICPDDLTSLTSMGGGGFLDVEIKIIALQTQNSI